MNAALCATGASRGERSRRVLFVDTGAPRTVVDSGGAELSCRH